MKTILASILLVISSTNSFAWNQRPVQPVEACVVHSPYGFAHSAVKTIPLCREGYLSAYDPTAKIPRYVSYTLEPKNAMGCVARTDAFVADQSIKEGPTPDDYSRTGYDKGHMAPGGDMSWDQQVQFESFLMTNMVPQAGSLNRGIWKLLETSIRGWVIQQNTSYTIYTGGIYNVEGKRIGKGVIVPHGYYKIIINNRTGQVAGWMFPHDAPYPNLGTDLTKFRVKVDDIESRAGVNFFYPANAVELQPGQEWPVNFGSLTNAKRTQCAK